MVYGQNHNLKFNEPLLLPPMWKWWHQYMPLFAEAWHSYHTYWLKIAEEGNIPVYFFRYEDLLADKKTEMEKIMSFICGIENV